MIFDGAECPKCFALAVPVVPVLLLDLNIQALDFLVQSGEWNAESVGGFGLVPAAFFQHIADDAAFAVFNDFEERGVRALFHDGKLAAAANEIVGQQFHGEVWPRCQHHGALNHVFQFAHIARPVILQQRTQGFGSYAQRQALIFFGKLGNEVLHEHRNVILALAQRRQVNGDHVETVEQIVAELAVLYLLLEIDVSGGDNAHVHLYLAHSAQVHELAVLQHAQDLGLRLQVHGANLIKEQRPAIGHLEQAFLAGDGAGEGAFDVAEERGLQQVRWHRTGVHRDERAVAARRVHVNGFGDQLFARTALALQQHGGTAGRHLRHQVEDAQHGLAFADDVLEVVALLESALQLDYFFFSAAPANRSAYVGQQFLVVPRLLDEVGGAGLHGIYRVLHRAVRRNHDDGQIGIALADIVQDFNAIAFGQGEIQQHQVEGMFRNASQALHAVVSYLHGIAFKLQQSLQRLTDGGFVVNDQHGAGGGVIF